MARPQKSGLEYFSFDVDFFSDEKVEALRGKFGVVGEMVAIRLLCAVYRNGHYARLTEMLRLKLMAQIAGLTEETLDQIIAALVRWEFFDSEMARQGVLTSKGIQRRYFAAAGRRRQSPDLPYLLLDADPRPAASAPQKKAPGPGASVPSEATAPAEKPAPAAPSSPATQPAPAEKPAPAAPAADPCGARALEGILRQEEFVRLGATEADLAEFRAYNEARGWRFSSGQPVEPRGAFLRWMTLKAQREAARPQAPARPEPVDHLRRGRQMYERRKEEERRQRDIDYANAVPCPERYSDLNAFFAQLAAEKAAAAAAS